MKNLKLLKNIICNKMFKIITFNNHKKYIEYNNIILKTNLINK